MKLKNKKVVHECGEICEVKKGEDKDSKVSLYCPKCKHTAYRAQLAKNEKDLLEELKDSRFIEE